MVVALNEEQTRQIAAGINDNAVKSIIDLVEESAAATQKALCSSQNDRDQHVMIGSLGTLLELLEAMKSAPMRAEAIAKRKAATGISLDSF